MAISLCSPGEEICFNCDASEEAIEILAILTDDDDYEIPAPDLTADEFIFPFGKDSAMYVTPKSIELTDLTTRTVGGKGSFDALMESFSVHLKAEYASGRITGAEYTKAFIALTAGAMQNATQFLLGRDTAYWQAVIAQANAISARIQMETAKAQYAAIMMEMLMNRANYALSKMKLATEGMNYATGEYQLNNILPQQLKLMIKQTAAAAAQTEDGFGGLIGKQKDLYSQQIVSYQKDAAIKVAKIYADAWTVMKTMDEGLLPPGAFTNASIDGIFDGL